MTTNTWNTLGPGSIIRSTKKRLIVGAIVGHSEKTGGNILRLHWLDADGHQSQASYDTAQPCYSVEKLVPLAKATVRGSISLPGGRWLMRWQRVLRRALRSAWRMGVYEWRRTMAEERRHDLEGTPER